MSDSHRRGVEYPARFHSVTVSGDDGGNMLIVVDLVTDGPQSLGEPPAGEGDESCGVCERTVHELDGVDLSPRGFHRFDGDSFGYYSGELEAFQR